MHIQARIEKNNQLAREAGEKEEDKGFTEVSQTIESPIQVTIQGSGESAQIIPESNALYKEVINVDGSPKYQTNIDNVTKKIASPIPKDNKAFEKLDNDKLIRGAQSFRYTPTFETGSIQGYSSTSATVPGLEAHPIHQANEDASIPATQISLHTKGKANKATIFGVMDGHGQLKGTVSEGDNTGLLSEDGTAYIAEKSVGTYIKDNFSTTLASMSKENNTHEALKKTFPQLISDYRETYGKDGITNKLFNEGGGATACMGVIIDQELWIANVGDSRAVFVDNDKNFIQLSEDAKIEGRFKSYAERFGGKPTEKKGDPRIEGLAIARSLEVKEKTGVTARPKITRYPIKELGNGHLIFASDGLWDVASSREVSKIVQKLTQEGKTMEEISKTLVAMAINNGSGDNITVEIVKLSPIEQKEDK